LFIFVEILSYSLAVAIHYRYVGSSALKYYQTVDEAHNCLETLPVGHLCTFRDRQPFTV